LTIASSIFESLPHTHFSFRSDAALDSAPLVVTQSPQLDAIVSESDDSESFTFSGLKRLKESPESERDDTVVLSAFKPTKIAFESKDDDNFASQSDKISNSDMDISKSDLEGKKEGGGAREKSHLDPKPTLKLRYEATQPSVSSPTILNRVVHLRNTSENAKEEQGGRNRLGSSGAMKASSNQSSNASSPAPTELYTVTGEIDKTVSFHDMAKNSPEEIVVSGPGLRFYQVGEVNTLFINLPSTLVSAGTFSLFLLAFPSK